VSGRISINSLRYTKESGEHLHHSHSASGTSDCEGVENKSLITPCNSHVPQVKVGKVDSLLQEAARIIDSRLAFLDHTMEVLTFLISCGCEAPIGGSKRASRYALWIRSRNHIDREFLDMSLISGRGKNSYYQTDKNECLLSKLACPHRRG